MQYRIINNWDVISAQAKNVFHKPTCSWTDQARFVDKFRETIEAVRMCKKSNRQQFTWTEWNYFSTREISCIKQLFCQGNLNIQGVQEKVKKSNHLFWHKNKVEFLLITHQLRGNICPFCLITLTKPWCLLFWSRISMQKILRNAKKCHFRPILAKSLYRKAYWGLF